MSYVPAMIVLALMQVIRKWNQTGQKHAGEPDIARTMLPLHNWVLWFLVFGTYFNITQQLARKAFHSASRFVPTVCAIALCAVALGHKIAFTEAEAPELLIGFPTGLLEMLDGVSLVVQARAVFVGIGTFVTLILLSKALQITPEESHDGMLL